MSNTKPLMIFDPATGAPDPYPSEAEQYRKYHGNVAWLYNPYEADEFGAPIERHPIDIGSDVFGHAIVPKLSDQPAQDVPPPAYDPDCVAFPSPPKALAAMLGATIGGNPEEMAPEPIGFIIFKMVRGEEVELGRFNTMDDLAHGINRALNSEKGHPFFRVHGPLGKMFTESGEPKHKPCRCGPEGCADSQCPGRANSDPANAEAKPKTGNRVEVFVDGKRISGSTNITIEGDLTLEGHRHHHRDRDNARPGQTAHTAAAEASQAIPNTASTIECHQIKDDAVKASTITAAALRYILCALDNPGAPMHVMHENEPAVMLAINKVISALPRFGLRTFYGAGGAYVAYN